MPPLYQFDFGSGAPEPGYMKVTHESLYREDLGYGFTDLSRVASRERGEQGALRGGFCIPLGTAFIVNVPSGNYDVALTIGDAIAPTETTVKAGSGRLMLHKVRTEAGQFTRRSFAVHVHDGRLRLVFSGSAPRINALVVTPSPNTTTVFLVGDSTVTDEAEDNFPYAGWGMMLPHYFKPGVAVANYAKSGRSSKSFHDEGRLAPVLAAMKPHDYLLIQFGHNDQKTDAERYTDPETTYKEWLKVYVDAAREKGAYPILVTSVHRRYFAGDGTLIDTHKEYLTAVRELAAAEGVPLIDLAEKSRRLFEELGPEATKSVFLWAVPGEYASLPDGAEDNTHFHEQGALRIAALVAEGLKELQLLPLMLYMK
ncbi:MULTISPECIES: rhamnogalacturonan acetylesterase [Paenibacillus]|uniref:rhamnogalacturonan acetylesterase n=1 Tax=Paenibacillus TaxID=44249 RepID=UPI0022B888B0|nr:GDSL-type esterase/lipase family protein [Paenibacillus caseinilyticus]MCZ8521109.1 GDSL-type esterase/lipase family protein [Paenibacillus caseinilyticus]